MKHLFILFALLLATTATANPAVRTISIAHPYGRPTAAPGVPGVGFLTLTNTGKKADRLLAVSSPLAGSVEIHQSKVENGVMKMRALTQGVVLPAGQSVVLSPGDLHLMLFELRAPLVVGDRVPLQLTFERAGQVMATLLVEPREPPADTAHEHHADHQH